MQSNKQRYLENCGFIDPKSLPINEDGFRSCRYCKGSIKPPKRTFCSANCVHEYRLRSSGTYLRSMTFKRDHGICNICGIDTTQLAIQIASIESEEERKVLMKQYNISSSRKINLRRNGGGLWDADHIIPVKSGGGGGGQCGLDNIRTLCISCHKLITFSR